MFPFPFPFCPPTSNKFHFTSVMCNQAHQLLSPDAWKEIIHVVKVDGRFWGVTTFVLAQVEKNNSADILTSCFAEPLIVSWEGTIANSQSICSSDTLLKQCRWINSNIIFSRRKRHAAPTLQWSPHPDKRRARRRNAHGPWFLCSRLFFLLWIRPSCVFMTGETRDGC